MPVDLSSSPRRGLTVGLVDWHWMGHHPNFLRRFAAALALNGATVVPFVPRSVDAAALHVTGATPATQERILPSQAVEPRWAESWLRRSIGRWTRQALRFALLRRQLDRWERDSGQRIDVVFFACIYDWEFDIFGGWLGGILGRDWSGLYLQARHLHAGKHPTVTRMFASPRLRSLATLDPGIVPHMRRLVPNKRIVVFPEVIDAQLPGPSEPAPEVVRVLLERARGRAIVSLVGWLQRSKGIETFTEAARDPRLRHLYFFLGGEINWHGIDTKRAQALQEFWRTTPNLHTHLERFQEGSAINAVLAASDVVVAAYLDFPYSSNILAKAATMGRPIIVSRGFYMAEQVDRYRLGATVPQGDAEAMVEAILRLTGGENRDSSAPSDDAANRESLRRDYCRQHSNERLLEAFSEILAGPSTGDAG
jgi:glycosyltransferase involved in cell wall biosynthesis